MVKAEKVFQIIKGDLISGFPKVLRCLRDGVLKGFGEDLRDRG